MSSHQPLPFEATAILPAEALDQIRPRLVADCQRLEVPVSRNSAAELRVETRFGTLGLLKDAKATHVQVQASREDWLYLQKERFISTVADLSDHWAELLAWSDSDQTVGQFPPNFQLITVDKVEPVAGGFLRVTATATDLSHFGEEAIHFRLALPAPENTDPEWPYLAANGKTIWPGGTATLHRPVYTVRFMDHTNQQLIFDVFEHDGGRVTEWARNVQPGDRVGLTGPGGGGIPTAQSIRFYADETGFPALARILESLPETAQGHIALELNHPDSRHYPLPEHDGFSSSHHRAGEGPTLAERAIADLSETTDHMIWLAAEKTDAQTLRRHCKTHHSAAKGNYIAAYWSKAPTATE